MDTATLILTTWPDAEVAKTAALALLAEKLVACINILPPMESYYIWQNSLQCDIERQMLIKSWADCTTKLKQRIQELHPYESPEFLVLPIADGLPDYLNWIKALTRS